MFDTNKHHVLFGLGHGLAGHIDMGKGQLGAETIGFKPNGDPIQSTVEQRTGDVQDVKIVGASDTSLRNNFLVGVTSSLVAGVIVWYAFEKGGRRR